MRHKNKIVITGAREHNLKNINLSIPKDKLICFCGVSGSGKSSLAFDTLFAEGQRRYVQSLSTYARQFLGVAPKPDVDQINGLSPSIAIDQKGLSHNPRSTVGTVTEVYDYLRLLFAKVGTPTCPSCNRSIERQTPAQVAEQIYDLSNRSLAAETRARFLILAPVVKEKKGEFSQLLSNLQNKGFRQVRIDGHFYDLSEDILLIRTNRHSISVVIDRINLINKIKEKKKFIDQVIDNIEMAFDLSDGLVILSKIDDSSFDFPKKPEKFSDTLFSRRFSCPVCRISLPPIQPRMFSFNSPLGACSRCRGIGSIMKVDERYVSSDALAKRLEDQFFNTQSTVVRKKLESLMIKEICPECAGKRLNKEALSVLVDNKNIGQVSALPLDQFFDWINVLDKQAAGSNQKEVASVIIREIKSRIRFLIAVGVTYLTLNREATTLSTGEGQRIRLASQLGTGLSGVLYILDEPTVGLHPQDTNRLIGTLKNLRDLGNTVIVVEHDEAVLGSADYLIEFGPEAGQKGGKIVATGSLSELKKNNHSLTGQYLSGKKKVENRDKKLINSNTKWLKIDSCSKFNLKSISVKFPIGGLSVVVGVSGSGKSTLVCDILEPALKTAINRKTNTDNSYKKISGFERIDRVLVVDQSPIGKTSRSNPATYVGIFDDIRELFARTKEARMRGLNKSHFSFNVAYGRCPRCEGQGMIKIRMEFLSDVWVKCDECNGKRFKDSVLEIGYRGKNIADVLQMTINQAAEFFIRHQKIFSNLSLLKEIGLGYLRLGQISPNLSGGESQRLKLARELVKRNAKPTVYLLDEPTTGLHFADLEKLLTVLRKLTNSGHTVILIEHNPEIIKQADWLIELGPEGGELGGYLIAEGSCEQLKKDKNSITGQFI